MKFDKTKLKFNIMGDNPIGSCGFRTGLWYYIYDGKRESISLSIPHSLPIEDQKELVLAAIKRVIESN